MGTSNSSLSSTLPPAPAPPKPSKVYNLSRAIGGDAYDYSRTHPTAIMSEVPGMNGTADEREKAYRDDLREIVDLVTRKGAHARVDEVFETELKLEEAKGLSSLVMAYVGNTVTALPLIS